MSAPIGELPEKGEGLAPLFLYGHYFLFLGLHDFIDT